MIKSLITLILFISTTLICFAQWNVIPSNTVNNLKAISFFNATTGFAVGDSGTIIKTTDTGQTWVAEPVVTNRNLNRLFFVNATTGFIAGDKGTILKTTDAGTIWTVTDCGISTNLKAVYFFNENNGIAIGDNGLIIKTTNGGNTWDEIPSPSIYVLNAVSFINNTGFIAGNNGMVLKSDDGGDTWTIVATNSTESFYGISFYNDSTIYIAGTNGTVLKTINSGNSWTKLTTNTTVWFKDVFCYSEGRCYAVGNNGKIYKSSGNNTWILQNSGVDENLQRIYFVDTNTGFIPGDGGTILKISNAGNLVPENTITTAFKIYPNPCSGSVNIEFGCKPGNEMSVALFNSLSQKVYEQQFSGNNVSLDLSGFQNGLYIVRVSVGDVVESGYLLMY